MNEQARASKFLRSLQYWNEQLHWYLTVADATDLSEFDRRVRESFPYEWDNAIGRFAQLERLAQRGQLSASEQADFRRLASKLTALLPELRRRRLQFPDLDALARAAARPATAPTS